jgi:Sulfotransferase family
MIISHAHRFIFIKTNKTAGTSIEAALTSLCGDQDVITPFRAENEQFRMGRGPQNFRIDHPLKPERPLWRKLLGRPERYWHPSVGFYEHMPAKRIREYVSEEVWNSYFKFAFDRNPWDRQVSWYFYKTKSKRHRPSFERFMQSRIAFVRNYELYAIDGKLAVDFVGRYENLSEDVAWVLKTIGAKKPLALPKTNVSESGDYRSYYTPALRKLVAEWYAPEIKLLDYTF